MVRNPVMFVVLVGSVLTTRRAGAGRWSGARRRLGFTFQLDALALVHGALRQLRRGDGRRPRQGPGRRAAQDPPAQTQAKKLDDPREPSATVQTVPSSCARVGDLVLCTPGRRHPGRRRGRRRRRLGGRVGHHRRVRAGHPRVGRRPLGRHRRHQGAVGPARHPHHRRPGRDLPRPDDRPGRGRLAPEDAERDRAHDPAVRAHDHLPAGRRHPAAVRHLQRRRRWRSRS